MQMDADFMLSSCFGLMLVFALYVGLSLTGAINLSEVGSLASKEFIRESGGCPKESLKNSEYFKSLVTRISDEHYVLFHGKIYREFLDRELDFAKKAGREFGERSLASFIEICGAGGRTDDENRKLAFAFPFCVEKNGLVLSKESAKSACAACSDPDAMDRAVMFFNGQK